MRKIEQLEALVDGQDRMVKVFYVTEYEEYTVRLYVNKQRLPNADYFTSDKEDALSTAHTMVGSLI